MFMKRIFLERVNKNGNLKNRCINNYKFPCKTSNNEFIIKNEISKETIPLENSFLISLMLFLGVFVYFKIKSSSQ